MLRQSGESPLHVAMQRGNIDTIKFLISVNANMNQPNNVSTKFNKRNLFEKKKLYFVEEWHNTPHDCNKKIRSTSYIKHRVIFKNGSASVYNI